MSKQERVAIITGASSGIGRATAIAMSDAGWNVVLSARREEQLQGTARQCKNATLAVAGDVCDPEYVSKLFKETLAKFGRLDMLFNNAGISSSGTLFGDLTVETFNNVLQVNVMGSFLCAKEAFNIFKNQNPPGGRIINNGSLAAHAPRPFSAPYTVSKHAITGLTKQIALDGRAFNITCTQIDIGNAITEMSSKNTKGIIQADGRTVLKEPGMDCADVANSIVHIASLPNTTTVLEFNIMATGMPYVGRG